MPINHADISTVRADSSLPQVIVEQHKFYHQEVPILYQLLLIISTQVLGYAFAGLTRRFLVRPSAMIWPGTLMSTAMFSTMHRSSNKKANGWSISRYRFFILVWAAAFVWYFVPGLLMPALSYFNVVTWFAPQNVVVSNLVSPVYGASLPERSSNASLTDIVWGGVWTRNVAIDIRLGSNCLHRIAPSHAMVGSGKYRHRSGRSHLGYRAHFVSVTYGSSIASKMSLTDWLITTDYKNVLFSSYMPILSTAVFDNTGRPYNVSRILTPEFLFDQKAYEEYSPVYLPITYVLSYGVQFAALTSLVTHTVCWYGKDILHQTRKAFEERKEVPNVEPYQPLTTRDESNSPSQQSREPSRVSSHDPGRELPLGTEDVHCRLMRRYEDAPLAWYLIVLVLMLVIATYTVEQ